MTEAAFDPTDTPGFAARRAAAVVLDGVLRRKRPLDEQLESRDLASLDERDRALTRRIAATAIRRLGTLRAVLAPMLERGLPQNAPMVEAALLAGATQILFMDVPDRAAVDLAVRTVQAEKSAARFSGVVNAVLRRVTREGRALVKTLDVTALDTPAWLMQRWIAHYGESTARAIALAHTHEPPLDLTVKIDPAGWAERLGGRLLLTGTVRVEAHGPVPKLDGFDQGAWWVQDAAAALPARLLGDVRDRTVADLCAAPGGKTAQLAAAGARVTAVDRSASRLRRLSSNLARLDLAAEIVEADATQWSGGPFDAVLLDAPCSATGTIRRHPDIPWLKSETDIASLSDLQQRLIDRAVTLLVPGGTLVFCTCSLEPEEGELAVSAALTRHPTLRRDPITPGELGGVSELISPLGELRSLPCHFADPDPRMGGIDGFFAARLIQGP